MTRERLNQLGMEELVHLCDLFDVDVDVDMDSVEEGDRAELVEALHEVMEERRRLREDENTFPVSYHQQKFENLDELFGEAGTPNEWGFEFPQSYNVTRIELMLRDPWWAFAYWDISVHDKTNVMKEEDFDCFLLRLEEHGIAGTWIGVMDVPVGINDSSWYLNLPVTDRQYRVSLMARVGDAERSLAHSQRINVPAGKFSEKLEVCDSFETDALIFLSGIERLDERGVAVEVPRRILNIKDSWEE